MTRILISNRQQAARPDTRRLKALARWLLDRAADLSPGFALGELSVALLDDAGIRPINEAYLGHAGATDVISFAYPDVRSAELLLNVQRAVEEARRRRGDVSRELALYLAHGIQHLAGRDDATPAQRRAMQRVQQGWLRAAGRAGLDRPIVQCS